MIKYLIVRMMRCQFGTVRRNGCPEEMDRRRKMFFIDVSKAHLYALINEDVNAFVDLPPECAKPGMCGKLNYWLYGMRPASKGWEIEYTKRLASLGFVAGKASPCCFSQTL